MTVLCTAEPMVLHKNGFKYARGCNKKKASERARRRIGHTIQPRQRKESCFEDINKQEASLFYQSLLPPTTTALLSTNDYSKMNSARSSTSASTQSDKNLREDSYKVSTTLLTFLVAAVIALILSLGLPTFATQVLSGTCPGVNPRSGEAQSTYFLSLYNGFSSLPEQCINNKDDFCIGWSSPVWSNFTSMAGIHYAESVDLKYASATQGLVYGGAALVVAALCAAFFALVLFSLLLCYRQLSKNSAFATFLFGAIFVFASCLLSLGGILSILFAAPFQESAWTTFFRRGGTFDSLITESFLSTPTTASVASCQVSIPIVEGGALLATSIVLLFIISIWSCCSACVVGPSMFEEVEATSTENGRECIQSTHDLIPPPTSTASAPSNPWGEQEGEEKTVAWAETGTTRERRI